MIFKIFGVLITFSSLIWGIYSHVSKVKKTKKLNKDINDLKEKLDNAEISNDELKSLLQDNIRIMTTAEDLSIKINKDKIDKTSIKELSELHKRIRKIKRGR